MFNLTSLRGIAAVLSIPALMLTQVACNAPVEVVDVLDVSDEEVADAERAAQEAADAAAAAAEEAKDEVEAVADELAGAVADAAFGACHESNTKGANSDGVLVLQVSQLGAGTKVIVTVTLQDGSVTETIEATVGEDGRLVVVMPLNSYGEVITLVSVSVDGAEIDLGDYEGAEFIVEEESSSCDLIDADL